MLLPCPYVMQFKSNTLRGSLRSIVFFSFLTWYFSSNETERLILHIFPQEPGKQLIYFNGNNFLLFFGLPVI